MKNKIFCFLFLFFLTLSLDVHSQDAEKEEEKAKTTEIISFLEYLLNTLGDPKTSARDKDVIVTESYTKIFRDSEVQVEDDLDENRDVITNKDVTAYLKDVNFFFRQAAFDFEVLDVEESVDEDGERYYKVSIQRNLQGITVTGDTVNQTIPRFIEINVNPEDRDMRIASIYTNELNQNEAWKNWWEDLSYEWRSIFLSKLSITGEPDLKAIKSLENLEELDLSGNDFITDIRPLSRITGLKKLSLARSGITSIVPIRNLNELKELDISYSGVGSIDALKYASALKIFRFSHTPVQDISVIARMAELEVLEMAGTFVLDFTPLASLPKLQVLDLSMTEFNSYDLLENMAFLQVLDISGTSNIRPTEIARLKSLRQVYADSTNLTSVAPFTTLEKLDLLSVNHTEIKDISPLSQLNSLTRIYCDQTGITQTQAKEFMSQNPGVLVVFETEDLLAWWAGLPAAWKQTFQRHVPETISPDKEGLAKVTQLDSLNLAGNNGIETFLPLTRILTLKTLIASDVPIATLDALSGMRDLEYLDISKTNVTDISPLLSLTNLEVILANSTQISDLTPVKILPKLKLLHVDKTLISDTSAVAMARLRPETLIIFKSEKLLTWWDSLDETWQALFKGMMNWNSAPDSRQLHELISRKEIETHITGLNSLMPLKEFVRLKKLDISGTGITDLNALYFLPTLTELLVARNPLSNTDPISRLTELEYIDVSNTPVSELDFLKNLTELLHVNCSGTQISRLDPLENLRQLKSLDCSNTNVKRLDPLIGLSLESLKCYNTRINERRVEEFKQLNPECSVSYY
jgi:Leucine-rich repeat (LRR) protein